MILIAFLALACTKESEPANARIHYYLTVEPSAKFDALSFDFEDVEAYREYTGAIQHLNLKITPQHINCKLKEAESFALGMAEIDPETIDGYNFDIRNFTVVKGNDTLALTIAAEVDEFSEGEITPTEGADMKVSFTFKTDRSIVEDPSGELLVYPQIKIQAE